MAETVMSIVLSKLTDAVIQEALFLYGVRDKIERLQHDLTWIRSFLRDADAKRHKNERVKCWVNEVQEVGYLIEDTLDKFLIDVAGDSALRRIGKLPVSLVAQHKIGTQIDKIQQRIIDIAANTEKYGIKSLEDGSSPVVASKLPVKPPVIPDIDETEVIGFDIDNKTIVDQLIDTNITGRSVISIVGAGGTGKTTLAKAVYDVKRHFVIRQWLTVSQEYKLIDILIKILEGIEQAEPEMRQKGEEYLSTKLYDFVRDEKYLVVLDDVWSSDLWKQLQVALPNSNNGSRVLITTRSKLVAEEADARSKPYEIKPLNEEKSQQLLLKKIFPNQYESECPDDLLPLVPQFAKKCGGWPLALVVLGGIMSRKIPNYNTWYGLMRNIDWSTDGQKCMGVISTSYNDLPPHLKTCFMYFTAFPEDYQVKAATTIKLWVAEGFIPHNASKTMEDIAESYLEELVQRCLVQVSKRHVNGKIKYCHVHDLLREVAIHKAKEDNFLTVFSRNNTHCHLSGNYSARRVSLQYGSMPLENATTDIRTLNYFGDNFQIQSWKKFGMLRVLNIQKYNRNPDLEPNQKHQFGSKGVKTLTLLRYLEINDYDCHGVMIKLPFFFDYGAFGKLSHLTRMKNLQTVNVRHCKGNELPAAIWENKQLRHVIIVPCIWCLPDTKGPPSSANLENLLTLKGVIARPEWGAKLPHFPHLRKLALSIPDSVDPKPIVNSLSNLQDLGSLSLNKLQKLEFQHGTMDFRNHQLLYTLELRSGRWPKQAVVDCGSVVPPHLMKLNLSFFHFEEDPMPRLEKLPNLVSLDLQGPLRMATGNRRMICSSRGFSCLQQLRLAIGNLEEWKIEEGAMPQLNKLQLSGSKLNIIPDLQYLTNIQELDVSHLADESKSRLEGDDQWKIKHIPYVNFTGPNALVNAYSNWLNNLSFSD